MLDLLIKHITGVTALLGHQFLQLICDSLHSSFHNKRFLTMEQSLNDFVDWRISSLSESFYLQFSLEIWIELDTIQRSGDRTYQLNHKADYSAVLKCNHIIDIVDGMRF